MSRPIIEIRGLSKCYRLGAVGATSLREELRRGWDRVRGIPHPDSREFWALRDVSLDIQPGEVVGVIGRNGAGKSTLLKILSRITEPTAGTATLRGRVASLLEVGTGFHAELTGRENVYLNGAILGMNRAEIRGKFDEIVAFAEVDKFIDTPVKHYSSGMYVRLAFAVAAHLEPEILIVDEVLAVGDVNFQKKCMGRMRDVSREYGRTVLLVSHNLDSILRLCGRTLWMHDGKPAAMDATREVVTAFLNASRAQQRAARIEFPASSRKGNGRARFAWISSAAGQPPWVFLFGTDLQVGLGIDIDEPAAGLAIAYAIFSGTGVEIASTRIALGAEASGPGKATGTLTIEGLRLVPGTYTLNLGLWSENGEEDFVPEAVTFDIVTHADASNAGIDTIGAATSPRARVRLESQNPR